MATPIRIKRSAVSGKKPQNIDLQVGELALNTYDGSLFTKRDTGGVGIATTVSNITPWVENFGGTSINYSSGDVGIGSDNPKSKLDINGSLNVSGVSTFSSNINLLDGISAKFGTDLDGEIKHTGNNLQIQETTGNIQITNYANDKDVDITSDDGSGSTALYFKADGSTGETILYNYGSEKIKTTSTGVSITGTIDTDQLNVSGVSTFTGDITANGNIVGDDSTNISGIASVTATTFHGSGANLTSLNATNLTGTINGARLPNPLPAISGQNLTDITADGLSGSPNINVSNIVGTALSVSGISTFNGDLLIEDSIIHVGDPNTKIRFPIDNEVSIETAGDERLRINSSGQVSVGTEPSSGQGLFNIKPSSGDEFFKVRDAGAFDASLNGVAVDIRNAANNTSKDLLVRSQNLVLWQSGAEKLRILSDGKIGIGTTNPQALLDVDGQTDLDDLAVSGISTFTGNINANGNIVGDNSTAITGIANVTGQNVNSLKLLNVGYVGNTTTIFSTSFLHFSDQNVPAFGSGGNFTTLASVSGLNLIFDSNNNDNNGLVIGSGSTNTSLMTTHMVVSHVGKVGIGSTLPTAKLDVTDGTTRISFNRTNNNPHIDFKGNNAADICQIKAAEASGGGVLQFFTKTTGGTSTQRFTIDEDGNIGIGSAIPAAKLEVLGDSNLKGNLKVVGVATFTGGGAKFENGIDTFDVRYITNTNTKITFGTGIISLHGNVGINSTAPTSKLDVVGDAKLQGNLDVAGIITASSASFGGDVSIGGTLTYEDVTNIDSVGLITARQGIFIPDNQKAQFGNAAGSADLEIYHMGNHSRIADVGTGKLQFGSDTGVEVLTGNFATQIALFDSTQILLKENTSVTGNLNVDGHTNLDNVSIVGVTTVTGALNIINSANTSLKLFDSSGDPDSYGFFLYNNGNDAADALIIGVDGGNEQASSHIRFYVDGLTGSAEKLRVDSAGINVTGILTATSFSGSGVGLTGLTGASAATYGNSTNTPVITVDANGRITTITTASISGGGGGGSIAGIDTTGTSVFNNLDIGGDLSVGGASITNTSGTAIDFNGSITASDVITAGALLHEGDTNTLVHFSAADTIELKTGGTSRILINNSGVALQNSSTFNVNGGRLIIGDSTGTTNDRIVLGNNDDLFLYHDSVDSYIENSTGKLRILGNTIQLGEGDDKIGIGTSVPDSALHVITAEDNVGILSSTNNGANLDLYDNDTQSRIRTVDGKLRLIADLNNNVSNSAIQFYVDNSLKLHIDDNIGIGTDAPEEELHILDSNPSIRLHHNPGTNIFSQLVQNGSNLKIRLRNNTSNGGMHIQGNDGTDITTFVRVTSTGNVGIGTVTPDTPLHIYANDAQLLTVERASNANSSIRYRNTIGSMYAGLMSNATGFAIDSDDNLGASPMFMVKQSDGNVAIGTVTPASSLHIHSGTPRITMSDSGTGAHHRINADSSVGNFNFDIDYDSITSTPAFIVNIKGSERLRITGIGSVGIGTNNPSQELTVYGADPIISVQEASASSQVDIGTGTVTGFINIQKADGTRNVQITANGDSYFSGGDVGIGTDDPTTKLHISGTGENSIRIDTSGTGISFHDHSEFIGFIGNNSGKLFINAGGTQDTLSLQTGGSEKVIITSGGDVGIGTDDPQAILHVEDGAPGIRLSDTGNAGAFAYFDANAANAIIHADKDNEVNSSRVAFAVDNSEKVRITSDGQFFVGVTTTTGNEKVVLGGNTKVAGNLNVTGVLTYEDVTNIDSVGLVTARSGIVVVGGGVSIAAGGINAVGVVTTGSLQVKGDANPNAVFDRGSANTTNVNFNYNGTLTGQLGAANADFQISAAGATTPISFYTNGDERLRINSAGNVGINSTVPQALLDVEGDGTLAKFGSTDSTYEALFIKNNVAGYPAITNESSPDTIELRSAGSVQATIDYNNNDTDKFFRVVANQQGSSGTEVFRVQEDGKVGIGITNPQTTLHIKQTTDNKTDGFRISRANSNATYSQFINGVDSSFNIGYSNPNTADPSPQITLLQNGRVGINTISPGSRLEIWADDSDTDTDVFSLRGKTSAFNIRVDDADAANPTWTLRTYASEPLAFGQGTIEIARFDGSGNLGIGTDNPNSELEVFSDTFADITINSARTSGNIGGINFRKGGVAAGIMTAQYIVDVNGNHFFHSQGSSKFKVGSDGNITIPTGGNLGINGAAPQSPLDVIANGSGYAVDIRGRSSDDTSEIHFCGNNSSPNYAKIGITTTGGGVLTVATNSQDRFKIDQNGNTEVSTGQFTVGTTVSSGLQFINDGTFGTLNSIPLTLRTASETRLTIDTSGNIGIGITNPTEARVRIKGANNSTTQFDDGVMVTSANETVYKKYSWTGIEAKGGMLFEEATGSFGETMRITTAGNVGIGSAAPSAKLDVNGSVNVTGISTLGVTSTTDLTTQDLDVTGNNILLDHGGSMSGVTTIGSYYYDKLVINSAVNSSVYADNPNYPAPAPHDMGWTGFEWRDGFFQGSVMSGELSRFDLTSAGIGSTHVNLTVQVATKSTDHRYHGQGSTSGYVIFEAGGSKSAIHSPFFTFTPGRTYRFDQSHNSNSNHQIRFYLEADKTTLYSSGVTYNGTAGSSGAYTQIEITDTTPNVLHYQCVNHLYMGNSFQTNSNTSSNTFTSVINANNGINLTNGDNKSILLGDSDDMRIRHTGSHSEITDEGTGSLRLGGNSVVIGSATFSENNAVFTQGGGVSLGYTGNTKLATTNTGVVVTGILTATSFVKSGGTSSQYLMADGSVTTGSGGSGGVTVQDEGGALSTTGTTLNFVGSGVVASGTGATKTITISGGGSGVTVQDEGGSLSTLGTTLNFVGSGVVASGTGATKTITISGGGGGGTGGKFVENATGIHTLGNVGLGTTNASDAILNISTGAGVTDTVALDIQGTEGSLFSVTNNLTSGSLFSINDVSGIPAFDYNANGKISMGAFADTVAIGKTSSGVKLGVKGSITEGVHIVANKLSAATNINVDNGNVHLFTTNETTTATPNVTSTVGLNTSMDAGDTLTVVIISKPNGAGYYAQMTIDGVAQTEEWLGGSAPSAASSGGYDVNTYNVIKTGDAAYIVLANTVNFA